MRSWTAWALMGVAISVAIVVATFLIGVARISPWLGRRIARSGLAVAGLRMAYQIAAGLLLARHD
jgi:hypothetical protein